MFSLSSILKSGRLPSADEALSGREAALDTAETHFVNGRPLKGPYPEGFAQIQVGMGCFWGAERMFWNTPGVWVTSVGYAGGHTPNATYREVCSGQTGHAEVVHVVYDPEEISTEEILKVFWEGHDPTQGMRQGNDVGTQYRSAIYTYDDVQRAAAEATKTAFQSALSEAGYGEITTEIRAAPPYYFAEADHQQYLAKNPGGYCGLGGSGVSCPIGVATSDGDA